MKRGTAHRPPAHRLFIILVMRVVAAATARMSTLSPGLRPGLRSSLGRGLRSRLGPGRLARSDIALMLTGTLHVRLRLLCALLLLRGPLLLHLLHLLGTLLLLLPAPLLLLPHALLLLLAGALLLL